MSGVENEASAVESLIPLDLSGSLRVALLRDDTRDEDEYSTLLARYSADTGAHNNEAFCLTRLPKMPEALERAAADRGHPAQPRRHR